MAFAHVIDAWIEYPFQEFGDNSTKIYNLRCRVAHADYEALTIGTSKLTSLTTAKLIGLPASFFNSSARWVGDSGFNQANFKQQEFIRRFATVPVDHDERDALIVDLPKAYADSGNDVLFEGGPSVAPTRFAYTYSTNISSFTIYKKFQVTYLGYEVNWVRNSPATSPNRNLFYGGTSSERVAETTKSGRWMGDIYYAVTPYFYPREVYTA